MRNAVSLGGDSDTLACITAGITEAWYRGVPMQVELHVMQLLPGDLAAIVERFRVEAATRTRPQPDGDASD